MRFQCCTVLSPRSLEFLHAFDYRFKASGIWWCVRGRVLLNVLKKPRAFNFKGQAVQVDQPVEGWRGWHTIQGGQVVERNMYFDKAWKGGTVRCCREKEIVGDQKPMEQLCKIKVTMGRARAGTGDDWWWWLAFGFKTLQSPCTQAL